LTIDRDEVDLLRLRINGQSFLRWLRRLDQVVLELDSRLAGRGHRDMYLGLVVVRVVVAERGGEWIWQL